MQFIKTRNVKNPIRDITNAGIDCYIPANTPEFSGALLAKNATMEVLLTDNMNVSAVSYFTLDDGVIHIAPHKDVIIPSGIRSKFGPELALIANNKSGIATKKKLIFGASVIDSNYEGEWHYHLINTSDEFQTVECDTKVIQFIPHLISTDPVEVLDMSPEEFYKDSTSSRGEGWAGSTGIK